MEFDLGLVFYGPHGAGIWTVEAAQYRGASSFLATASGEPRAAAAACLHRAQEPCRWSRSVSDQRKRTTCSLLQPQTMTSRTSWRRRRRENAWNPSSTDGFMYPCVVGRFFPFAHSSTIIKSLSGSFSTKATCNLFYSSH
jgi:hypothetical protein